MIDSEALHQTQRAQAADWQALLAGPVAAPGTVAAVATPRRNLLGLGLAVVWLVVGGGSLIRFALSTPAPGTAPALSRIALMAGGALVGLLAVRHVLFTLRARLSVSAGVMSYRAAVRTRAWQPGDITGIVAVNTSSQPNSPHIHYVVLGPGARRPVLRGGRFSADSMAHVAAALGVRLEVRPHRVTSRELVEIRSGRSSLPRRAGWADG